MRLVSTNRLATIRLAVLVAIAIGLLSATVAIRLRTAAETGPAPEPPDVAAVRQELLLAQYRDDRSSADMLRRYAERTGVSLDTVGTVLSGIAEQTLQHPYSQLEWTLATEAIYALGMLRLHGGLPVLKKIATQPYGGASRNAAIRAIVTIGGPGLLDFAREMAAQRGAFDVDEDMALYDTLAFYVGVDPFVPDNPQTVIPDAEVQTRRAEVLAFLQTAVTNERSDDNRVWLDKLLVRACEPYRTSPERDRVLLKLEKSECATYSHYATEALQALKTATTGVVTRPARQSIEPSAKSVARRRLSDQDKDNLHTVDGYLARRVYKAENGWVVPQLSSEERAGWLRFKAGLLGPPHLERRVCEVHGVPMRMHHTSLANTLDPLSVHPLKKPPKGSYEAMFEVMRAQFPHSDGPRSIDPGGSIYRLCDKCIEARNQYRAKHKETWGF